MKKKDWLLVGIVLLFALAVWICNQFIFSKDNLKIRITVDGEVYGEYSLDNDQEIAVGKTNICRIKDGKVKMIQATCPDKLCMHQSAVGAVGGTIVCLPNRVVIEAIGADDISGDGIDGIS